MNEILSTLKVRRSLLMRLAKEKSRLHYSENLIPEKNEDFIEYVLAVYKNAKGIPLESEDVMNIPVGLIEQLEPDLPKKMVEEYLINKEAQEELRNNP